MPRDAKALWSDILERPDYVDRVPKDAMSPVIWGYESDHPFPEQLKGC